MVLAGWHHEQPSCTHTNRKYTACTPAAATLAAATLAATTIMTANATLCNLQTNFTTLLIDKGGRR